VYEQWDREEDAAEREKVAAAARAGWPDRDPKPYGGIRLTPPAAGSANPKAPVVYHDGRYHTLH